LIISKSKFLLFVDFALTNQMSGPYFGITLETCRSLITTTLMQKWITAGLLSRFSTHRA